MPVGRPDPRAAHRRFLERIGRTWAGASHGLC